MRVGILTVSDGVYFGKREDKSGAVLKDILLSLSPSFVHTQVVPDDAGQIRRALEDMADGLRLDLVITTGGTGLGPRDVTPEATRAVVSRLVPGIPIALIAGGMNKTPYAALSRAEAGIRNGCLIINLPGSPKAVREGMEILLPILPHALKILAGGGHELP